MQIISHSQKQTFDLGKRIARFLNPQDIICLYGPLGAGKTIFVKGLACGLGVSKNKVKSPAFVLINEYSGKIPLYHIDLYRLKNVKEILTTGWEDYFFQEGIMVIEWAQRLKDYLLPLGFLKVEFEIMNKNTRKINLSYTDKRYAVILEVVKNK